MLVHAPWCLFWQQTSIGNCKPQSLFSIRLHVCSYWRKCASITSPRNIALIICWSLCDSVWNRWNMHIIQHQHGDKQLWISYSSGYLCRDTVSGTIPPFHQGKPPSLLFIINATWHSYPNILRPELNMRHFADHIFKYILLNENILFWFILHWHFFQRVQLRISHY